MATMELRAELFQSINPLLDNECLNNADEEIETHIRQSFNELNAVKEGKSQTRDFFEVVNEL